MVEGDDLDAAEAAEALQAQFEQLQRETAAVTSEAMLKASKTAAPPPPSATALSLEGMAETWDYDEAMLATSPAATRSGSDWEGPAPAALDAAALGDAWGADDWDDEARAAARDDAGDWADAKKRRERFTSSSCPRGVCAARLKNE